MGFAGDKSVTYRRGKADKVMADLGANVAPTAPPGSPVLRPLRPLL
jgi:hypothetical protein